MGEEKKKVAYAHGYKTTKTHTPTQTDTNTQKLPVAAAEGLEMCRKNY